MEKKPVKTDKAPAAIGPYSQAIKTSNMLFISGQLPIDPKTGVLVEGIDKQTRQALKNLEAILNEANASLNSVVKTTLYLRDMEDFQTVNTIYSQYFNDAAPARSCIGVLSLPKDASIEIEAIAVL